MDEGLRRKQRKVGKEDLGPADLYRLAREQYRAGRGEYRETLANYLLAGGDFSELKREFSGYLEETRSSLKGAARSFLEFIDDIDFYTDDVNTIIENTIIFFDNESYFKVGLLYPDKIPIIAETIADELFDGLDCSHILQFLGESDTLMTIRMFADNDRSSRTLENLIRMYSKNPDLAKQLIQIRTKYPKKEAENIIYNLATLEPLNHTEPKKILKILKEYPGKVVETISERLQPIGGNSKEVTSLRSFFAEPKIIKTIKRYCKIDVNRGNIIAYKFGEIVRSGSSLSLEAAREVSDFFVDPRTVKAIEAYRGDINKLVDSLATIVIENPIARARAYVKKIQEESKIGKEP